MPRPLLYFITFAGGLFVQFGWAKYFAFAGLSPNVILIALVLIGLTRGSFTGQLFGFFWGLSWDVLSVGIFGSHAFLFTCLGYLSGKLSHKWNESKVSTQILLTGVASAGYWAGMAALSQVFGSLENRFAFNYIIYLQPLYNMAVAPLLFKMGIFANALCSDTVYRRY